MSRKFFRTTIFQHPNEYFELCTLHTPHILVLDVPKPMSNQLSTFTLTENGKVESRCQYIMDGISLIVLNY